MQCPECKSTPIRKTGKRSGKQNHSCVACGRQFLDHDEPSKGYPDEVKRECLKMSVNGMGVRAIGGNCETVALLFLSHRGDDCKSHTNHSL